MAHVIAGIKARESELCDETFVIQISAVSFSFPLCVSWKWTGDHAKFVKVVENRFVTVLVKVQKILLLSLLLLWGLGITLFSCSHVLVKDCVIQT